MTEAQLKDKVVTDLPNGQKTKAIKVRGIFNSVIETLYDLVSSLTSGATAGIPAYSAATTYAIDALVISADNKIWKSLQNSNLNNATVEGAWWTEISPATLVTPTNIDSPFTPENNVVAVGDTLKKAFEKVQGQINNVATLISATVRTYTRAQGFGATTLTDGATINWDCDLHQSAKVTLAGNRTLANPTNVRDGFTYILRIVQDGTGSRTLAYGSAYKFQGGVLPILSTTANAKDRLTCIGNADGTLDCVLTKDFR